MVGVKVFLLKILKESFSGHLITSLSQILGPYYLAKHTVISAVVCIMKMYIIDVQKDQKHSIFLKSTISRGLLKIILYSMGNKNIKLLSK